MGEIHCGASHGFAPPAAGQIYNLGRVYEQQTAFKIAAGIYADFAKFAAGQKTLSQKTADHSSVAERVAFAEAAASMAHARKLLMRWAADRKPDAAPPEKLSEEFAAAIAAYKSLIEAYGDGPSVGEAVRKIMAVGRNTRNTTPGPRPTAFMPICSPRS